MKFSKLLPVLCALVVSANCLNVHAEDNPAQAAARIALAQKLFDMGAQQPEATNMVAAKTPDTGMSSTRINHKEAKAEKVAAAAKAKVDWAAPSANPKPEDENNLDAQRAAQLAALTAALAEKPATEAPAKMTSTAPQNVAVLPQPARPTESSYAGKNLGLKPIVAPALPITASKEEQLQALLMKYKFDLISPEEYQKQRTAILAEP